MSQTPQLFLSAQLSADCAGKEDYSRTAGKDHAALGRKRDRSGISRTNRTMGKGTNREQGSLAWLGVIGGLAHAQRVCLRQARTGPGEFQAQRANPRFHQ